MSMIPEVMIREKLIRRVGGVVDSRPTRPLREDKCRYNIIKKLKLIVKKLKLIVMMMAP